MRLHTLVIAILPLGMAAWMTGCSGAAPMPPSAAPASATSPDGPAQPEKPNMQVLEATFIGTVVDNCTGKGTYDALELSDLGEQAFEARDWVKADACYALFVQDFPDHKQLGLALFNLAVTEMQLQKFVEAQKHLQTMLKKFPTHPRKADARLQLGKAFLEQGNYKMALQIFRNIANTPYVDWYDKIESLTQMGRAEIGNKDYTVAEEYFWQAYHAYRRAAREEGYADPYGLAQVHFYRTSIKEILMNDAFIETPKDDSEEEKERVFQSLERKARWLLDAQTGYLKVIRTGHAYWATAAGYKIGSLYERLYDEITAVPSPPGISEEEQMVYRDDLIAKVSVLLRKSLIAFRKVCDVANRIQVQNEWVKKSRASMDRLIAILTETGHLEAPKKKKKEPKPEVSPEPKPQPTS